LLQLSASAIHPGIAQLSAQLVQERCSLHRAAFCDQAHSEAHGSLGRPRVLPVKPVLALACLRVSLGMARFMEEFTGYFPGRTFQRG